LALLGLTPIAVKRCQAAEPGQQFSIAYRLTEPKTLHFDDPKTFAAHLEQCQKLGCEVTHAEHAGHGDVTYKSPRWRALTVPNDELVHQWEGWLQAAGFETLHGHAEEGHAHEAGEHSHDHDHAGAAEEEVVYRLPNWATLTVQQPADADELVAIAQGLGCEVKTSKQGNSAVVSIHCPNAMHIECATHEAAEFWHAWLTKTGFEASHED